MKLIMIQRVIMVLAGCCDQIRCRGKIVMHTGDNPGYATQIIRYIDEGKIIILLSNNAYKNFDEIIRQLE